MQVKKQTTEVSQIQIYWNYTHSNVLRLYDFLSWCLAWVAIEAKATTMRQLRLVARHT